MVFVEELKKAFSIITKPREATKDTFTLKGGFAFYYKVTVIPAILGIIIGVLGMLALGYPLSSFLSSVLGLLVIAPIGFIVGAAWLHLFGKFLLKTFKGTIVNTFSGVVYSYMPSVVLFWLAMLLTVVGVRAHPLLSIATVLSVIIAIWSFIISLFALANQNSTTKLRVFATQIVASIPIIVVVILASLFALNFFNGGGSGPSLGTSCIGQPGFSCSSPMITQGGVLSFALGQGLGQTVYNVSIACVSASDSTSPTNYIYNLVGASGSAYSRMANPSPSDSATSISSGEQLTLTGLQCYPGTGSTSGMLSPIGSTFVGSIWMAYSSSPGGSQTNVKIATVAVKSSS